MNRNPSAMPGCVNCNETGLNQGFHGGKIGTPCPCLAHCHDCMDALVPWESNDEGGRLKTLCHDCNHARQESEIDTQWAFIRSVAGVRL